MLEIKIDSTSLNSQQRLLLELAKNQKKIVATSMTLAVSAAKTSIKNKVHPAIKGGPTRWTERGLIAVYAQPDDLRAAVGYNYDQGQAISAKNKSALFQKLQSGGSSRSKGGGVSSGRYMEVNASNRTRNPKSSEIQLRNAGILKTNQFIVPNPGIKEIDSYGNLPGGFYTKVLSQLGSFTARGATLNTPAGRGSRGRTAKKRNQNDFFLFKKNALGMRAQEKYLKAIGRSNNFSPASVNLLLGQQMGHPLFIARRIGDKKRGYEVVFYITNAPRYTERFPIQKIASDKFYFVFNKELNERLEAALRMGRIVAPLILPIA